MITLEAAWADNHKWTLQYTVVIETFSSLNLPKYDLKCNPILRKSLD